MNKIIFILIIIILQTTNSLAQQFAWAKQFTGNAAGKEIIRNSSGHLYIMGYFSGTVDFDPGPGVVNLTCSSSLRNTFIAKMDTSGNLIWVKQIAGSNNEPNDITLDNQGNLLMTGFFSGTVDMDPSLANQNITSAGLNDLNFLKLDDQGNYISHFRIGGSHSDFGGAVGCDMNGNVFIAGTYAYTVDVNPNPAITLNLSSTDSNNMFMLKFSNTLTLLTAKKIESGYHLARVLPRDLKIDSSGNIYLTGEFRGTIDFDPFAGTANLSQATGYGTNGVFVGKYTNDLLYNWIRGFSYDCNTPSINLSSSNEIYLHFSYRYTVDADPGEAVRSVTAINSGYKTILVKLNSSGNYIWHKPFDLYTYRNAGSKSIYLDGNNSVTVCGLLNNPYTNRHPDFIEDSTSHTISPGTGSYNSGYLVQVDTAGNTKGVRTIQNNGNSSIQSVVLDNSGNIYSTGICQTTCDFNPGPGVFNLSGKGFVQKLSPCLGSPSYSSLTPPPACDSVKVHGEKYTKSGTYTHIFPNAAGCDSIITVNATVWKSFDTTISFPLVCNSVSVNGITYTTTGNYTQNYTTINGCDSVYHINVVVYTTAQCTLPLVSQLSLNYWNHSQANAIWTYNNVNEFNLRYKATSSNTWNYIYNIIGNSAILTGLQPSTQYEYQIMPICGCSPGYSASKVWSTTANCVSTSDISNNNSIANAKIAPLNCDITGTLSSASDVDFFYIYKSGYINISLTQLPANYNIELYNASGTLLNSSNSFGTNSEYISTYFNLPESLYVKILGINNASSLSCYKLKIDGYGSSPCPTAPSLNSLTMPSWGDTYATFQWNAVSNTRYYKIVYRELGTNTWLVANDYWKSTQITVNGLLPNTTYEWAISTWCSSYGGYSAYSSSKVFTTTPTCQSTFDGANNNSTTSLPYIPYNTNIIGRIDVATDVDYYKIAIPSASPIMISATSLPANYQLSFYNSAMTLLATSNSADTNAENITITPPAGGDYFIRIQGVNGSFSPLCYNLKIINSNIPCSNPTPNSQFITDLNNSSATCNWNSLAGAVSYTLQYRVLGSATWTTISNIFGNNFVLDGLTGSTTYEWAIRGNCLIGNSTFSTPTSFITTSVCQGVYDTINNNSAGAKFIPTDIPISGRIEVLNDIDFYKVSLINGSLVHINLFTLPANYQLSILDSMENVLHTSNSFAVNAEHVTFVPGYTGNYLIKINGVQNSFSFSQCYTLKVNTFNIPCSSHLISDLSMSMWGDTYATCIWNSEPGAVNYTLRYRVSGSPSWITLAPTAGNSLQLSGLLPATTYEWQLRSNCSGNSSVYSPSKIFTTTSNCQSTNDHVNNNTSYGAITIPFNTNIYGMVSNSTDVDYYKFIVDIPSSTLHISLKTLPANYNFVLYNNSLQQLASATASGLADELMQINLVQGTYYIAVVPVSGSFNNSSCYTLKISNTGNYKQNETSTEPVVASAESLVKVYPNPTNGMLNINHDFDVEELIELSILDMSGRVVYSAMNVKALQKGNHSVQIDLSTLNLSNGLYILHMKTIHEEYRSKIHYRH